MRHQTMNDGECFHMNDPLNPEFIRHCVHRGHQLRAQAFRQQGRYIAAKLSAAARGVVPALRRLAGHVGQKLHVLNNTKAHRA